MRAAFCSPPPPPAGGGKYVDIIEKAVGAYSPERIDRYIAEVEAGGIAEHGFPRLASNLGVLIANELQHERRGADAVDYALAYPIGAPALRTMVHPGQKISILKTGSSGWRTSAVFQRLRHI